MVFLFFFGGVSQEVRNVIEQGVAACPRCDSEASLVNYDNVFRAFFIPIWRWSGDNPAVACDSCTFIQPLEQFTSLQEAALKRFKPPPTPIPLPSRERQDWTPSAPALRCWSCSSPVDLGFKFCPQCGSAQ